jgi:hypothetical protein
MLIKWDTLLIAIAVAGGSVLIENSHRIDTGAPDNEVVASPPDTCVTATLHWDRPTANASDDGYEVVSDSATPPVHCANE